MHCWAAVLQCALGFENSGGLGGWAESIAHPASKGLWSHSMPGHTTTASQLPVLLVRHLALPPACSCRRLLKHHMPGSFVKAAPRQLLCRARRREPGAPGRDTLPMLRVHASTSGRREVTAVSAQHRWEWWAVLGPGLMCMDRPLIYPGEQWLDLGSAECSWHSRMSFVSGPNYPSLSLLSLSLPLFLSLS